MKDPSTPFVLKTVGYLVSTLSVLALGVAAWPGADDADLTPWLIFGMIASVGGMVLRWTSYFLDKCRADRERDSPRASPPGNRPVRGRA